MTGAIQQIQAASTHSSDCRGTRAASRPPPAPRAEADEEIRDPQDGGAGADQGQHEEQGADDAVLHAAEVPGEGCIGRRFGIVSRR